MNASWKIQGKLDGFDKPIIIGTIKVEMDFIISEETVQSFISIINIVRDIQELNADGHLFASELEEIHKLYISLSDLHLGERMNLIKSEWQPFEGIINFDVLKKMQSVFSDVNSFSFEGDPENGLYFVFNFGTEKNRMLVNKEKLLSLESKFNEISTNVSIGQIIGGAVRVAEFVEHALNTIKTGKELWDEYEKRKQAERDREAAIEEEVQRRLDLVLAESRRQEQFQRNQSFREEMDRTAPMPHDIREFIMRDGPHQA